MPRLQILRGKKGTYLNLLNTLNNVNSEKFIPTKGRSRIPPTFGLTPAAIHYAIERGERFLKENEEMREALLEDLTDLTTSP